MDDTTKYITVIKEALFAAELGDPPDADLLEMLDAQDLSYPTEELEFDSLQVMEFCISVEINSGAPLSLAVLQNCPTFVELMAWLKDHASVAFKSK